MDLYSQTQQLLDDLSWQLKKYQLWSEAAPTAAALQSQAPFCVDTMRFETWLQFVFMPRLQALIDGQMALPTAMQVAPMAEVMYQGRDVSGLVNVLLALDTLCSNQHN